MRLIRCCYLLLALSAAAAARPDSLATELRQAYQDYAANLTAATLQQHAIALHKLENWSEDQSCSAEHLALANQALARNASSIAVRYLRYQCTAASQPEQAEQDWAAIVALSDMLLASGAGFTAQQPMQLRELGEALTLFELAGYQIVEFELISHYPQLLFRLYLRDTETQAYEHRYVDNFAWIKKVLDINNSNAITASQYTAAALDMFARNQYDFARLFQARQLLKSQQTKQARNLLQALVERSYLATSALAELYLQQQDKAGLEALLPELIAAHESGEPSASAALSLMVLLHDSSDTSIAEARQVLFEHAAESEQQLRQELLLEMISRQATPDALLTRWFSQTVDIAALDALYAVASRLQAEHTEAERLLGQGWHRHWTDLQQQFIRKN
ncbi:MAG: hypothetical protein KKE08_14895 [Gammaproteobacteria bacterium]|nr:hypothetical protein [Gammaproteobacteria bacterium]MBU2184312.1 hypothetical protein [Gammaproteobacteria bacterium]MBU2206431.1 hypothetical protein [Gammaproteobacteria bacterium]